MTYEMSNLPWIKSYPPGVHWDARLSISSLPQLLDDAARMWPDRPALEFMGRRITYRELHLLAGQAAKGFQQLGVRPGTHVGLCLPNTPHYVVGFFGVLKAGGTVVNYSPGETDAALEHKINDSGTDIIVTLGTASLHARIARLLRHTRLKKMVVGSPDDFVAPGGAAEPTVRCDEGCVGFAQLLDNDGRYQPSPVAAPDETVAVLQYTSGTSGPPKGAMLTHANLTAACSQLHAAVSGEPKVLEEGRERLLAVLPLSHIYALTVDMLFGIRMGAELVLHSRFELDTVIADLAGKRITMFAGAAAIYAAIVGYPGIEDVDLSALKFCVCGGAPLPADINQSFQRLTGCSLIEGWGMTETSPTGTFTPVYGMQKAGSCGLPMAGVAIKFVDIGDPSRNVELGERGELCIKGPNVMKGYWNNPQATAESMTPDGFFRTGDVGSMDEDGFVYIVDRGSDLFVCNGCNVYPRYIEDAIREHPAVAEVGVIGVPDIYRGRSPKAFVTLKPDAPPLSLAELKSFLKRRVGKQEMVRALEIRDRLPKTPIGKLSKKELYDDEARKRPAA